MTWTCVVVGIVLFIAWIGYEVWRAPLADQDGVIRDHQKSSDSNSKNP